MYDTVSIKCEISLTEILLTFELAHLSTDQTEPRSSHILPTRLLARILTSGRPKYVKGPAPMKNSQGNILKK